MYKVINKKVFRVDDNRVYCYLAEKWITIEEYKQKQAKKLQEKIARDYELSNSRDRLYSILRSYKLNTNH